MSENLDFKKVLTESQLALLDSEFSSKSKKKLTSWLLWVFLGGLGIHSFYLGDKKKGAVYVVLYFLSILVTGLFNSFGFLITFIVLGLLIYDAIKMNPTIDELNEIIELEIINDILSSTEKD